MSTHVFLFILLPMILGLIGFISAFFEIRAWGVREGMNPANSIVVMGPALRDPSHPMRPAVIRFIVCFLVCLYAGIAIAADPANNHPVQQPPH